MLKMLKTDLYSGIKSEDSEALRSYRLLIAVVEVQYLQLNIERCYTWLLSQLSLSSIDEFVLALYIYHF